MTNDLGALERENPGHFGKAPVEAHHESYADSVDLVDGIPFFSRREEEFFAIEQMRLLVGVRLSRRSNQDGGVVDFPADLFGNSKDEVETSLLRDLFHFGHGVARRGRLREHVELVLTSEKIPRVEQLGEDDRRIVDVFEKRARGVNIFPHAPELGSQLEESNFQGRPPVLSPRNSRGASPEVRLLVGEA